MPGDRPGHRAQIGLMCHLQWPHTQTHHLPALLMVCTSTLDLPPPGTLMREPAVTHTCTFLLQFVSLWPPP